MVAFSHLTSAARAFDRSPFSRKRLDEWAMRRLREKGEEAGRSDPEWHRLDEKMRSGWYYHEFVEDLLRKGDIENRLVRPDPIKRFLMMLPRVEFVPIISRWEKPYFRSRRGWAPDDVPGLDWYVCRILDSMLLHAPNILATEGVDHS